uniref:poly(ADP-ribose) glycohydrolase n=1 Tax=Arcella intermedia TaxID=1963864 RepID=A0A6B2L8F9_9EUKA
MEVEISGSELFRHTHARKSLLVPRKIVACLLANAFFGTLSPQHPNSNRTLNFATFLKSDQHAFGLSCIINYFICVYSYPNLLEGHITIQLNVLEENSTQFWSTSTTLIRPLLGCDSDKIEHTPPHLAAIVNFANPYPGGLLLSGAGLLQEEILYLIRPELLVTIFFCDKMRDNEAIIVNGTRLFSLHEGYRWDTQFLGKPQDLLTQSSSQVISIDAAGMRAEGLKFYLRDLNKAYCGFSGALDENNAPLGISTGNWGCGAFGMNKEIKAIQQMLASSQAGRSLYYHTFGDEKLAEHLQQINNSFVDKKMTVSQVYLQQIEGLK